MLTVNNIVLHSSKFVKTVDLILCDFYPNKEKKLEPNDGGDGRAMEA